MDQTDIEAADALMEEMGLVSSYDPGETVRLFIAFPVSKSIRSSLPSIVRRAYPKYIEEITPAKSWHITMAFLGEVPSYKQYMSRLLKPLPQAYVPTISVTHVGRGLQRQQLWAYVNPTQGLLNIRKELFERLKAMRFPQWQLHMKKDFIPHIRVARLYDLTTQLGLPDAPVVQTYPIDTLHVYRSTLAEHGSTYTIEGTIDLSHPHE